MKIVFFGNASTKIAAIRYRVVKFADMLEADGHHCVVCLPSSIQLRETLYEGKSRPSKLLYLFLVFLRRIAQLRHMPGADVAYFRGPVFDYGPPLFERLIGRLGPRLEFDIDDAIWEPPAHVDSPFLKLVDFGWVRKMAAISAHAVVGNGYLADYVRPHNPHITIIPTCIDMDIHTEKERTDTPGPVVLGWTGLKDNLGYLEIIEDLLQDLAAKHDIKLLVSTGRAYHLDGVKVENHYWTAAHEIDYLRAADIGLMPLKDTPRARGKCAFKALQYMAVGVPAIVSPVGMNAEVIEDGITGYLADTPEEWRGKLERLITDATLRERMGAAARRAVEANYSHAVNYPKLKAALESLKRPNE